MIRRTPEVAAWVLAVAASLAVGACKASPAKIASAPIDASLLVTQQCLTCHTEDLLAQQRITRAQWDAVVKKMQGWGALLTDTQLAPVAEHLSARYPADAPTAQPTSISADAVEAALARQPEGAFAGGDPARGAARYAQTCSSCHGPRARGDGPGVNLVRRPILQRATEFAEVVRHGRRLMPPHAADDRAVADLLAYLGGLGE